MIRDRCVVSNVEVFVESASRAFALSSILLCVAADSDTPSITSTAVGHFHDEFMKQDEKWLFAERRGFIALRSAAV